MTAVPLLNFHFAQYPRSPAVFMATHPGFCEKLSGDSMSACCVVTPYNFPTKLGYELAHANAS